MAPKFEMLAGGLLLSLALSADAARTITATSIVSRATAGYRAEVQRMVKEKRKSETRLENTTTLEDAYDILKQRHKANATALSAIEGLHARNAQSPRLRARSDSLLEEQYNPAASLAKANGVLGQMITDATMEYDQLHLECSSFFKKQCTLMETCREDISGSNSIAAEARSRVLSAQTTINYCEIHIPRLQFDLTTSIKQCKERLGYLRRDLKIVLNDISVMESVLNMTQCTGKFFMQMPSPRLLKCNNRCKQGHFTAFGHEGLHSALTSLQSKHVRQLVQEGLEELAEQGEEEEGKVVARARNSTNSTNSTYQPAVITKFKNAPLPQQPLPDDPCAGIDYDDGQGKGGCTLRKSPACFNLQNKFLTIQGETVDKHDELVEEIALVEAACKETKETLEAEIQTLTTKMADAHTKLAESTSTENSAVEEGQMKGTQHTELKSSMLEQRSSCSSKFRGLESELCALKKIRGELNKMKGAKHPFFQDCEVSEQWEEHECTVSCGGGTQELTRAIISPPSGAGALCPPLKQVQACSEQPCPIDCKMTQWSGFSACSADCGGGVSERSRTIKVHAAYDGEPCGDVEETVPCNMQACDKNCKLAPWTEWSSCSKACDSGTRERIRIVEEPSVGRGKCPLEDSRYRLERKECNRQACVRDTTLPLLCESKVDVVLLLDGSGSVGASGWNATKAFAKTFVKGFGGANADAQVAIILYSGPYSYTYMRRCTGSGSAGLNMETDCKIKMVQHFSSDMMAAETNIDQLAWPMGTTLTSAALTLAQQELNLGRAGAKKIVLTITDGIPLSSRSTWRAAKALRKEARLMFGAVKLSTRGLGYMMKWGSRPTKENVLKINSFADLQALDTIDTLITDICPNITTPTVMAMPIMTIR